MLIKTDQDFIWNLTTAWLIQKPVFNLQVWTFYVPRNIRRGNSCGQAAYCFVNCFLTSVNFNTLRAQTAWTEFSNWGLSVFFIVKKNIYFRQNVKVNLQYRYEFKTLHGRCFPLFVRTTCSMFLFFSTSFLHNGTSPCTTALALFNHFREQSQFQYLPPSTSVTFVESMSPKQLFCCNTNSYDV